VTKEVQTAAGWMDADDQVWLGRWAREWATDPKNHFCNPAKPNEMDRQLLSLFDSIEECRDDIDTRLETLHETWSHLGLLAQTAYRYKMHYLFRGVGYQVAMRARELKTDSAEQTLLNWNRVQNIYNGQDGSYKAAEAWIGPADGPGSQAPARVGHWDGKVYQSPSGIRMEGVLVDFAMEIRDAYRDHKDAVAIKTAVEEAIARGEDRLTWDDGVVTDA
jgi:hypothetical protein